MKRFFLFLLLTTLLAGCGAGRYNLSPQKQQDLKDFRVLSAMSGAAVYCSESNAAVEEYLDNQMPTFILSGMSIADLRDERSILYMKYIKEGPNFPKIKNCEQFRKAYRPILELLKVNGT